MDVRGHAGHADEGSRGTVVMFGDSLTDGAGSTPGAENRYPDELAERLVAAGKHRTVVNAGLNGNLLLTDFPCFAGDKGLSRFRHDVLDQPGVRTAVVLLGHERRGHRWPGRRLRRSLRWRPRPT